jgi:hypothetical protein
MKKTKGDHLDLILSVLYHVNLCMASGGATNMAAAAISGLRPIQQYLCIFSYNYNLYDDF